MWLTGIFSHIDNLWQMVNGVFEKQNKKMGTEVVVAPKLEVSHG